MEVVEVEVELIEGKEEHQSLVVVAVLVEDMAAIMYKGREASMEAEVVVEDKQVLLLNNMEARGVDTFMETLPILPILTVQVEDMVAEMVEEVETVNMDIMVVVPEGEVEVAELIVMDPMGAMGVVAK
jgi:hypothetical protein